MNSLESDVYVMPGSMLAFQDTGVPFREFPAQTEGMLTWHEEQSMLVIWTCTVVGAVHLRTEEYAIEPPLLDSGWEALEELSANFGTGDVRFPDLEEAPNGMLPDRSLVSQSGRYRVRLYETGRESGIDLQMPGDDLVERYLMQLWPETAASPRIPLRRL